MQKENAIIICLLAIATATVLYLVLFGLPPPVGDGNQSDDITPGQNGSDAQEDNQSAMAELQYHIGGCGTQEEKDYAPSRGPAGIAIDVSGDKLILAHNLTYVCCAEITVGMKEKGWNLIVLTETNTGEMCRCICDYTVDATVGPLAPGTYDVQLWGVAFENTEPGLMFEENVSVG